MEDGHNVENRFSYNSAADCSSRFHCHFAREAVFRRITVMGQIPGRVAQNVFLVFLT